MSKPHPLYQPENRRRLKIAGIVLLLLSLAAEPFVSRYGYFGFDAIFGFNAAAGLLGTLGLIAIAFVFFLLLQREDDYYDGD